MAFSELIRQDAEFRGFAACLKENLLGRAALPIAVNGLSGGAVTAFVTESIKEAKRESGLPVLLLVPDEQSERRTYDALIAEGVAAYRFKKREFVFHNVGASHDVERERLSVLSALIFGGVDCVIATPSAAVGYTVPRERLEASSLSLAVGDIITPAALSKKLADLGFAFVETVDGKGQFSHRGGIVDLFPGESDYPVRIEFFGDEIDRMVYFDVASQRALDVCPSVSLLPALEVTVTPAAREAMSAAVEKLIKKCSDAEFSKKLALEAEYIKGGLPLDFRDKYLSVIYPECESLLSYFRGGRHAVIILGTNGCAEELKKHTEALSEQVKTLISQGLISTSLAKYSMSIEEYESFLSENLPIHVNSFSGGISGRLAGLFGFRCRRTVAYADNYRMLFEDIRGYRRSGYRIILAVENSHGARSLTDALLEENIPSRVAEGGVPSDVGDAGAGEVIITVGECEGYDLISAKIALLSMAKSEGRAIMQNRRRQLVKKKAGSAAKQLLSYLELSVGDYVVHENYGIGMFEGIQTVTVDGVTRDYITIAYAGTDKLLVPCDKLDLVGKYIGAHDENGKVKLSKMGGGDWLKTKTRAKGAAKDIADELIKLYAARQRTPGFAFARDTAEEAEFADSFEYEETDSQLSAIEDIKRDMMRPVPMNRLLCGDVGFGKTEVALRAAFKAIMSGKQVAILVPTTILALQHYQTAISRMRNYAVNVEMLTRFRTPKEQENILRRTKRGEIDLLIGTHKLLSKKLEFRDVGLLIVDEEQRFGVAQKEKLKQAFQNIDVLTLSATPIPRTLNMAMNGISDISILDEAPGERRPVQTYVFEHDEAVIEDAIRKELGRGGQVLYLYNKVEDIILVADRVMKAIPEARVAYAHGKMEREELEDIWSGLVHGEIDVLVCTTIIETGVDLPNANTLIIENADKFGLSQLHQIRGRVGRSERQAYAYLTYRRGKVLSEVAEKRLTAIREFAEFGAGFKVAMRDLEIRGAGNLLGAEQHGYIAGVGYDLYIKLLNEAVLEGTGKVADVKREEALIDIRASAHIPEGYISNAAKRMEMYKKITLITLPEDSDDVYDELSDRFGEPPAAVVRLLDVALAKALATKSAIKRIKQSGELLWFATDGAPDLSVWSELFSLYQGLSFRMSPDGCCAYRLKRGEDAAKMAAKIMRDYHKFKFDKKDITDGEQ